MIDKLLGKKDTLKKEDIKIVPITPTNEQLSGLAHTLIEWNRAVIRPTTQHLIEFLENHKQTIPDWLHSELEIVKGNQFIQEKDVLRWIYKSMIMASPEYVMPELEHTS